MASLFKHTDDDGDLSVFASGGDVAFVCSKGHWWTVAASSTGTTQKSGVNLDADSDAPDLTARSERFGPDVLKAMTAE